ncbi:MAG: hypothetical protein WB816_09865 [Methylocystis sp.]
MDWLGSLTIMFIGACLTHHLTIGRDKLTARRNASSKFRGSVLAALTGLYPHPVNWPDDIDPTLRNAFPTLQTAVEEFRPFVRWWQRRAYDRAWLRYRCATGRQVDIQCYLHYTNIQNLDEPKPPTDAKITFHRNVSALLAFGAPT